jgi:hypothetical protein
MGVGHASTVLADDKLKMQQLEIERKQMEQQQQQLEMQRLQLEAIEAERKTLEAERKLQELSYLQQQQQQLQQQQQVQQQTLLHLEAISAERKNLEADKILQEQQTQRLHQQQHSDVTDELGPLSGSSAGSLRRQQKQISVPPPPSAATYRTRIHTISAAGVVACFAVPLSTQLTQHRRAARERMQYDVADVTLRCDPGWADGRDGAREMHEYCRHFSTIFLIIAAATSVSCAVCSGSTRVDLVLRVLISCASSRCCWLSACIFFFLASIFSFHFCLMQELRQQTWRLLSCLALCAMGKDC